MNWPARTRALPEDTQSITAELFRAFSTERDTPIASLTRNRTRDDAYTETLTYSAIIPDNTYDFVARAWSGEDGTGDVLATADFLIQTFPGRRGPLNLNEMLKIS